MSKDLAAVRKTAMHPFGEEDLRQKEQPQGTAGDSRKLERLQQHEERSRPGDESIKGRVAQMEKRLAFSVGDIGVTGGSHRM